MEKLRLITLSTMYNLKTILWEAGWDFVTLLDSAPEDYKYIVLPQNYDPNSNEIQTPVVVINLMVGEIVPYEIGGRGRDQLSIHLDIFGSNKGQRDDLLYFLFDKLTAKAYRLYNETVLEKVDAVPFPPTEHPESIGNIDYGTDNSVDYHRDLGPDFYGSLVGVYDGFIRMKSVKVY